MAHNHDAKFISARGWRSSIRGLIAGKAASRQKKGRNQEVPADFGEGP